MAELDVFCNFHKCRKRLNITAWVTSCSHAFCEEDGNRSFTVDSDNTCPACKTHLPHNYDVVRVDLNPSQQFRSMVLAGLRPEIVIDIAQRAISFWNYQIYMEHVYQTKCNQISKENMSQIEQHYESLIAKLKTQLQSYSRKVQNMKNELQIQTERTNKLMERVNSKQQEINTLQAMNESLKRTQLTYIKNNQSHFVKPRHEILMKQDQEQRKYSVGPSTLDEVLHNRRSCTPVSVHGKGDSNGFDFKPVTPSSLIKKRYKDPFYERKRQKLHINEIVNQ